jgi:fucose permease
MLISSKIIGDLENMCRSGLALVPYFYFNFKDTDKQNCCALLSSLLVQLCAWSDPFYNILSRLYLLHDHGTRQPSNDSLMHCLKEMLSLPGQGAVYIVMDCYDAYILLSISHPFLIFMTDDDSSWTRRP